MSSGECMKILITGSKGFIGHNLAKELETSYEVWAVGREELDLLNPESTMEFLKQHRFDVVIHAANINSSRYGNNVSDYELIRGNLHMFYNLVNCRDLYGKMLYFGSGAELDRRNYIPRMTEDYLGKHIPEDSYGLSKYVMASEISKYDNIYDLRLFGVFGPYEEWDHRFISNAICRALKGMPITINQNVFFDYLYVKDLARILKYFIEKDAEYKHYNLCRNESVDLLSLAQIIKDVLGADVPIIVKNDGLKSEYTADGTRMLKEIGDFKFTDIRDAISELRDYYKACIEQIDENKL